MHNHLIEQEISQLSTRYGVPLRRTAEVELHFDPLSKPDRYGEVCMVVRRPNSKLLTVRKTFYPVGAYRLLTGGVSYGERIYDALLRETEEETGLEIEVRRFLAVVAYTPRSGRSNAQPASVPIFSTFAFLVDEVGGTLACADPEERVADFREVTIEELSQLAHYLDQLDHDYDHEIQGRWRDWGHFRAVIHRVVYEALTQRS